LAEIAKRYDSQALLEKLNAAGVPAGPIYTIDKMFADPQVEHVGMAVPLRHPTKGTVRVVNQAVALSRTPATIDRPPPRPGEHTEEVLADLGYDRGAIQDLRRRNVI
jgi:formyl-CoA transferase